MISWSKKRCDSEGGHCYSKENIEIKYVSVVEIKYVSDVEIKYVSGVELKMYQGTQNLLTCALGRHIRLWPDQNKFATFGINLRLFFKYKLLVDFGLVI